MSATEDIGKKRLIAGIGRYQICGAAAGLLYAILDPLAPFWFYCMWIGGAVATPFGISRTLKTLKRDPQLWTSECKSAVSMVMAATFVVLFVIATTMLPGMVRERLSLITIRGLAPERIHSIEVCQYESAKVLLSITDPQALAEFCAAASGSRTWAPGKNSRVRRWSVVVHHGSKTEFDAAFIEGREEMLFAEFGHRVGGNFTPWGGFRSSELRAWFQKYVIPIASGT